jgi:5-methylcytosine-specific restriction endonuclease McrA
MSFARNAGPICTAQSNASTAAECRRRFGNIALRRRVECSKSLRLSTAQKWPPKMRNEFSRLTRRLAWARANGQCEGQILAPGYGVRRCNFPIDLGGFEYDHIIPDWMGGDNSVDNCRLLCTKCHEEKTASDAGAIAKVKRIRDKRSKALTSRRPMPFGRRSKLKKKISGEIVQRR